MKPLILSQSGRIVANTQMVIFSCIPAGIVGYGIGRLWPVMGWPVFVAMLAGGLMWAIALMLCNRGKRGEIWPSQEEWEAFEASSKTNAFLINAGTWLLLSFIPPLIAGLFGLLPAVLLPDFLKWLVFALLAWIWAAGGFFAFGIKLNPVGSWEEAHEAWIHALANRIRDAIRAWLKCNNNHN